MNIFGPKMGLGGRPDAHCATGSTQKPCIFHESDKKVEWHYEKMDLGPKNNAFLAPKRTILGNLC